MDQIGCFELEQQHETLATFATSFRYGVVVVVLDTSKMGYFNQFMALQSKMNGQTFVVPCTSYAEASSCITEMAIKHSQENLNTYRLGFNQMEHTKSLTAPNEVLKMVFPALSSRIDQSDVPALRDLATYNLEKLQSLGWLKEDEAHFIYSFFRNDCAQE
eukprot:TRINITY_DN7154_c0_g1_i1.p1 TRINITY_DN7154_c0_g1~~TRINITY_DN7154_c0_g1_i1.p1  ORF type:complete len:160 (+),score=31.45 TRINITY_DN7154_c0_g1_i1:225-704(+)